MGMVKQVMGCGHMGISRGSSVGQMGAGVAIWEVCPDGWA